MDGETVEEDINRLDIRAITEILDKKVALYFGNTGHAIHNVENKYFLDLVTTLVKLNPRILNYKPPNRQTLTNICIPKALSELEEKKNIILENTDSILLCDGWKNSNNNKKFLTFTLRNKNADQVFLSFVDNSDEKEDGETLANHMVDAIKTAKNKFKTKVFSIKTDNDEKIKCGARKASEKLTNDGTNTNSLILTTCYSHSGNLLLKSIVEQTFLAQLQVIVTAFSGSKATSFLYKNGGCKVKNYPDTRFCFVMLTCKTVLGSLDAMKKIITKGQIEVTDEVETLVNCDDFSRKLVNTINLITPICKFINFCQDPEVTLADGTEQWLRLRLPSDDFDEEIVKRESKAIPDVGYAANFLHPVYKGESLDEDQCTAAKNFINDRLNADGKAEFENFEATRHTYNKAALKCDNAFSYWSFREFEYPNLAYLAKNIMLIPASTGSLESLFSSWTWIHNKPRNRLSNKTTGMLIDLYHMSQHFDGDAWISTGKKRKRVYMDVSEDYY